MVQLWLAFGHVTGCSFLAPEKFSTQAGTRKAARFQRAVRLFRFHQVSRDEAVGIGGRKKTKVHSLVRALFKNLLQDLCWDSSGDRPSSIVTSRVLVHDPRTPPVVRIEPKVPPDCHRMRFNAALGWRWHRFTLSPGKVQILVQGPILVSQTSGAGRCRSGAPSRSLQEAQLHGDTVNQPPKFIIPTNDGEDGVEVKAKPWHEVQVQYALTDLGRPDGSTGGFYGLMRRTRFIKLEVLRRLFAEDPDGVYRPGLEGDFRDETLTQPLHNALASLESAPRPPGWNPGDDADLHVLEADSTMRTRMLLQYEKNELKRDILFLMGRFEQREGRLQVPGNSTSDDILVETMTVQEAMSRCHTLRGCSGFCFQGDMTDSAVKIHFKGFGHEAVGTGWTSFFFEDGESALVKLLAEQYKKRFLGIERSCRAATWAASLKCEVLRFDSGGQNHGTFLLSRVLSCFCHGSEFLAVMACDWVYIADSDEEAGETPVKRRRCGDEIPEKALALRPCITPGVAQTSQTRLQAQARPRPAEPARMSKSGLAHAVEKSIWSDEDPEAVGKPAQETSDFEGYTLRDLRRLVAQMLPRYGRLLTCGERAALRRFESLPLRAQQLFARLLSRKWPQWVALEGLGSRYRELSSEDVAAAVADLSEAKVADLSEAKASSLPECGLSETGSGGWATLLSQLPDITKTEPEESPMPWLLDTSTETAASLLNRQIPEAMASEDNYGKLLLSALPAAELRRMGKGLGISDLHGLGRRSPKSKLVFRLCEAAKQQRLLQTTRPSEATTEAQLVARSLDMGRWVCLAPSLGRRALVVLGEVFRLETCGAADSSYVVFSSRWPDFSFQPDRACPPLFADRASLDAFAEARRLVCGMEKFQEMRPSLDHADSNAKMAEEGLERALQAVHSNEFEAAKFRDPFRRRFTAAWCYAEALHHAVLHSPAVGHDKELQASKVRRLRLLLSCTLCPSQRGRWYAELAKEAARCEGLLVAIEVAAAGLAEGEDKPLSARIAVDLTLDVPSSQEAGEGTSASALLPRDARWDLARRCRVLARRLAKAKGSSGRLCDWQKLLQNTQVAQRKADAWLKPYQILARFQFNILDKLIAKNFTSHIPGSVGNKIWSTKSKTPEERAKIRAIVLTKTFYRNPTPGEGKPCFGEDAIEISWNGNVGDPPAYDTRGADPSPDPDGGNDDGNPPRKPGKGPDPDPPDGDDPDGGDDPEVTEVKISRREADKVVVPSFPTVPHLDNWMALWCMC
eukprot:s1894_g10.t1